MRSPHLLQRHHILVQPLPVRLPFHEAGHDGRITFDRAGAGIDGDHLAGAEAAFLHHAALVQIDCADLGRHDDQAVVHHGETRRSQTIAVEHAACHHSVGEAERGRTVPRLLEAAMVAVERALLGRHVGRLLPGLRRQHHHRVADVAA